MARRLTLALAIVTLVCGPCMGQGFMDSVLGAGGLGLWGNANTGQFGYQQFQNGSMYPGGQPSMEQPGYQQPPPGYAQPGGAPPQGYGYQPAPPYATQQGVYSDWHVNQPQAQQGPPPVQYQAPVQQPSYGPQQGYAHPATQLRPGQYSPSYPQPGSFDENLPAGAVRITTTTPDGTTIQYYPPSGDQDEEQVRQPPQRRQKPRTQARQTAQKPQQQAVEQPQTSGQNQATGSIAMPRPVEIPKEQDPRAGWGAAMNRIPTPQAQ